jgi:hypothetical protein
MENLIELVAASFARHGIESPRPAERRVPSPVPVQTAAQIAPVEPIALPEHNYRKSLQGDPAP